MSRLELAAILRAKAWRNYPGVFAAPERASNAQQKRYKLGTALILSDNSYRLSPLQSRLELFDTRPRPAKQTKHEWPHGDIPLAHFPNRLHRTPDLTEIQMSAPQTAHVCAKGELF
jgi:hypothetical protein